MSGAPEKKKAPTKTAPRSAKVPKSAKSETHAGARYRAPDQTEGRKTDEREIEGE